MLSIASRAAARLDALGIPSETVEHEPVFTVAESKSVKEKVPGAHSKNLFVNDKKCRFFLVTAKDDTAIDLKRLHETIGASGRLSFGSADQLRDLLGVEPGSVTPFAVVNDREGRVRMKRRRSAEREGDERGAMGGEDQLSMSREGSAPRTTAG